MKVLFIAPLPEPVTGQSLACQVFYEELRKRHEVEVVNLNKSGFRQGVDSLLRVLQVARALCVIWLKAGSSDVVYLTISESGAGNLKDLVTYAVCYGRLSSMVLHLHGGAGLRGILLGPLGIRRRVNEFFLRRVGGVVVLGDSHVDLFAGTVLASKIHVVPNFAEDYLFNAPAIVRRKFAQASPLRVLFLSNLLPGKGHLELLDALATMDSTSRHRMRVDFAGGFESEVDKQAFLVRISTLPQLQYHGIVRGEVKKRLLSDAHVLCLPTYYPYEGQPICILEAYAAGCAVITTNHSGIRDIFADGKNGFEVATQSSADLRGTLLRAASEPQQLLEMALGNLSVAMKSYRTAIYCGRLMGIVEGLGGSRQAGGQ